MWTALRADRTGRSGRREPIVAVASWAGLDVFRPIAALYAGQLDSLIEAALMEHEVRRLGLEVTEDELIAAITTMPELQENGRFSRDLLERILQSQRDRGHPRPAR